jgi:CRP-like cAMP-binding protein
MTASPLHIAELESQSSLIPDSAWENCGFGRVHSDIRRHLIETGTIVSLGRGDFVPKHPTWADRPRRTGSPGLVIDGLIRVFLSSSDRQVTLQYSDSFELFGVPTLSLVDGGASLTARAQALCPTQLLLFDPTALTEMAEKDLATANAIISALRGALCTNLSLLAENVLWSLRQRIARHMLDLAVRRGNEIVMPATVQDLADATGTVREVVTRLLKDFREQGLIDRLDGELVLIDARALHEVARGQSVTAHL